MNEIPFSLRKEEKIIQSGKMWYQAPSDGLFGPIWKPGHLYLTNKNLYWYYDFDEEILFQIPINKITKVEIEKGDSYNAKGKKVLTISDANNTAHFSKNKENTLQEWKEILNKLLERGCKKVKNKLKMRLINNLIG